MYDSEGRVQEEKSYKDGKLHGAHKTYFTTGKVEREVNYPQQASRNGKDIGLWSGTVRCAGTILIRTVSR